MKGIKRENITPRSIFVSVLAIALTLILIPLEVFAWFAIRNSNSTDDFELDVVGESASGGTINVFLPDGSAFGAYNAILMPGEYLALHILVSNVTDEEKTFRLNITDISVTYPTASDNYVYPEKIYSCPDYYEGAPATPADVSGTITEPLFRRFVAPVSNAIRYAMYYVEGNSFDPSYSNAYFTSAENATAAELASTTGVTLTANESYVPLSTAKTIGSETTLATGITQLEQGIYVASDGSLTLDSAKQLDVYLLLHFDPTKYSTADIATAPDTRELTLHNSNPYLGQRFSITLTLQDI